MFNFNVTINSWLKLEGDPEESSMQNLSFIFIVTSFEENLNLST